jgi:hypothetical protein
MQQLAGSVNFPSKPSLSFILKAVIVSGSLCCAKHTLGGIVRAMKTIK